MADESFSITNTTKTAPPINGVVFRKIKDSVLGRNYSLSLVIIGDKKSKSLNRTYRNKNKATDILSFSITKNEGEIFINPRVAKKKSKKFARSEKNFLEFLFIHGLCHLKGMTHGRIMEHEEEKFRKKFKI